MISGVAEIAIAARLAAADPSMRIVHPVAAELSESLDELMRLTADEYFSKRADASSGVEKQPTLMNNS